MEITTDILLRGTAWNSAIDNLSSIFKTRPNFMLYLLALSVGIMYDQRLEKPDENGEDVRHVPRNVIRNYDNGKLDFMFQAAILTTRTADFSEEERLELAFGEKTEFKKIDFLTQFANFGITKIVEHIGETPLESMDNLKNFLISTVEGRNLEIDELSDDILLSDDINN
ncbi:hypothetical protein [[Ruminococcus] torques]|uniref:hypothetical protein n=1 Tax=Mediterraneibacter glycyrrhizinilyticus TaxID=342942 RepID=UPI0006D21C87